MKTIWKWIDALARAVIALIGKVSPKLEALCLKIWNNTELVSFNADPFSCVDVFEHCLFDFFNLVCVFCSCNNK